MANAPHKPRLTVTCPHCRARYQSPWKKLYTQMDCAKCGRAFTLMLPDEPPLLPTDPIGTGGTSSPGASTAATIEMSVAPTLPESPGLDRQRLARPAAHQGEAATPMALVALALVGVAVVATQLPYGRIAAAALAPIGAVLALLSLLGLEQRRWLGWAGAGANGFVLLLVLALPDWLGDSGWTPRGDPNAGPKPVVALGRDGAAARPAEWVDASKAVWEQGDVRVAVTSVGLTPLDKGPRGANKAKEQALAVRLTLTNSGVARAIVFRGWPAAANVPGPSLVDADGKPVPFLRVGETAAVPPIYPGKSVDLDLLFTIPTKITGDFRLELSPHAWDGTDPVRFQLPRTLFSGLEAARKRPGATR